MKRILYTIIAAVSISLVLTLFAISQQPALKVNVDLVNVLFTVTDSKGRLVPGLTRDDFAIEEDGRKQDIYSFSRENELPLTIGMLIDTSASVSRVFADEKETAIQFLNSILQRNDLTFVIGFERIVTLVQDYTDDKKRLREAIN